MPACLKRQLSNNNWQRITQFGIPAEITEKHTFYAFMR